MCHLPRHAGPSLRLFGHDCSEGHMTRGVPLTDIDTRHPALTDNEP
jgi:hypothetical protein